MNNSTPPPIPPTPPNAQATQTTPPPINPSETTPLRDQPAVIDPLFLKSEDEIVAGLISRELEKSGFDIKKDSLAHIEKKKMTATLISGPINLIIIVLFRVFHYGGLWAAVLIGVSFGIWRKFQKSDLSAFLIKEIKSRPTEKFSDVIAPQLYDRCSNQKWIRLGILAACTFLIPVLMFLKPHVFYEDAPDGKYVRFYTEGLMDSETLTIPETVDNKPVKGIRGDVFCSTDLVSVTLPNSIDTIRGHAFEDCHKLTNINIPTNLRYLGGHAFDGCEQLRHVNLPKCLRYIGGYAFNECNNLTINSLPQEMDSIGGYAFYRCYGITNITLPENITEIHAYCFSGTRIKSITIPASVERIGEQAFSNTYLKKIIFEESSQLRRIGSRSFFHTDIEEVVLPPSVKEIRGSAFRECRKLKSAKIPQDCDVADRAFKDSPTKVERY
jgi:hypothetical protein